MEALMHFCRNWGDENCNSEVSDLKYPKEIKNGEKIPTWPSNYKKYDEICKKCEDRFFEIEIRDPDEKVCPVCGGDDFVETKGFEVHNEEGKRFENVYLKCKNCSTSIMFFKQS